MASFRLRSFEGLCPTGFEQEFDASPWAISAGLVKKWLVRVVKSEWCGEEQTIVEFYSCDTEQFVGGYFLETIQEHLKGLVLDDGVPEWRLDETTMDDIKLWLAECEIE